MRHTIKLKQARQLPSGSLRATWRGRDAAGLGRPAASNAGSFAVIGLSVLLMFIGSGMQGYANETIDALAVALLLLLAGYAVVSLVFPGRRPEMRAFLLTYAVCVFVGGLAQCYSLAVFHDPQSTRDSFTFLGMISPQPPFMTLADMPPFNSPLAVVIWQQVYKLTWLLGFKFGPYTGVMFNSLVMGLTGSLTVQTARALFGDDTWRLRRVGTLFAFCGLFILFGATLLRDCFATFFIALVLWGFVRFLVRMTLPNLFFAAVLTGVSAYAMAYLRPQVVVLLGLFWFLVLLSWFFAKRLDTTRVAAAIFALCVLLIATPYLVDYMQMFQANQAMDMKSYAAVAANESSEGSLGMNLVVNQPLPIRLIMGTGALIVNPIPLWSNFNIRSSDYLWIKGYNGIYQVVMLPLVLVGFIAVFRLFRRDRKRNFPFLFLVMFLLLDLAAVVATSLEQRHFAQFMPVLMVLAALPDTRDMKVRKELRMITMLWVAVVVLIHLAWLIMKEIA